jgi:hypothetical protein
MSNKAMAIERRHQFQCAICMLIDSDTKKSKWHVFREGYDETTDDVVCDDCLSGMKAIRTKCHHKVNNPQHKVFENFVPWFAPEVPGMSAAFEALSQEA